MSLGRFIRNRAGATAIEYAMIASFVAILIISSLTAMGVSIEQIFIDLEAGFAGVTP